MKSTCCDSTIKINGDVTHYYTCDKCGEACNVKAPKTIAERFVVFIDKYQLEFGVWPNPAEVAGWLYEQPENSKTFTLAEVEAIAREAIEECDYVKGYMSPEMAAFNDEWWQSKLKELGKK